MQKQLENVEKKMNFLDFSRLVLVIYHVSHDSNYPADFRKSVSSHMDFHKFLKIFVFKTAYLKLFLAEELEKRLEHFMLSEWSFQNPDANTSVSISP